MIRWLTGWRHSLLLRVCLRLAVGIVVAGAVVMVTVTVQVRHEVRDLLKGELRRATQLYDIQHADAIELHLDRDSHKREHKKIKRPDSGYAVYGADGGLLDSQGPSLPLPPLLGSHTIRLDDHDWMLYGERVGTRLVVVGVPHAVETELALEVADDILVPLLLAFGLLIPWTLWGVWRGLQPLNAFAREVQSRPADDLSPFATEVPREALPLREALNRHQHALAARIERERRFVADAAHELRTPLAGIQASLDLAASTSRDEARVRALANARSATANAGRLVAQLLELARLDHDTHPSLEIIDLAACVDEYERHGGERVERRVGTPLPVWGRCDWLALAVRNLVDNARRYGRPDGKVWIDIDGTRLTVSDDGPGVDPAVMARLGERFFRPPGQSMPGAGIGLSIVSRIVELCGGRVSFARSADGGLAVTLHLREAGGK